MNENEESSVFLSDCTATRVALKWGPIRFPRFTKKKKKKDLMGKMKVISFNYKTNKHENGSDDRRDFQKKTYFSHLSCYV